MSKLCILLVMILLTACGSRTDLAPVVELKWQPQRSRPAYHVAQRGETLYAIAFRYDQDFRQLAFYNRLSSPYALRIGQVLQLKPGIITRPFSASRHARSSRPVYRRLGHENLPQRAAKPIYRSPRATYVIRQGGVWRWPVNGRIVANFLPQQGKKGIDIAGNKGEKIRASSNGVVAYAGNGLTGYGNLIIIKHSGEYLTAYGNNLRNLVREGQQVKAGQIIAEMGVINRKFWGVHFEIRKSGQPVNPLNYLRKA